jgi:hypothetical protein
LLRAFLDLVCLTLSLILYLPEQKGKEEGTGSWYLEKGSGGCTGAD